MIKDIAKKYPTSDKDYDQIRRFILKSRKAWICELYSTRSDLSKSLVFLDYQILKSEERIEVLSGKRSLEDLEIVITCRVKQTDKIIGKMSRYGEALSNMLDIWGYRIIVSTIDHLDLVANHVKHLWKTPTESDLTLRRGKLKFPWFRDYRKQNHQGVSQHTSAEFDTAINLNRKTEFGVIEIQIITNDLFKRAFLTKTNEESHYRFASTRNRTFKINKRNTR